MYFHDRPGVGRLLSAFSLQESIMTQRDLNRSVARATGEDVNTIEARGFSIFDPSMTGLDDDLSVVNWDALEQERLGLFPNRQRRA